MPYRTAPSKAAREAALGPNTAERPPRSRSGTDADNDVDGPALREARSGVSRG